MSSVKRSLKLVEIIAGSDHPPTHAELARRLAIPKSTLSQLLASLRDAGYVALIDGRYLPGIQLISLSYRVARKGKALMAMKPALDRLAREAAETVLLAVRVHNQFMYVEQSPGPHPIRYAVDIGDTRPLETTAIGRVFLAFDGAADSPNAPDSSTSPAKSAALGRVFADIRRTGYSVNEGEVVKGVHAIAAPILDEAGSPIAALAVLGPRERMADMRKRIWPLLEKTIRHIQTDILSR
ncbi:MAG: IclR family transcriptional regulator [Hyphomicrobiales bacterium]